MGLAVCLLVGTYLRHELSYDQYLPNAENVYRMTTGRMSETTAVAPRGVSYLLEERFAAIDAVTEVYPFAADVLFNTLDTDGERTLYFENVFSVDSSFFDVFPYRLLSGTKSSAFRGPGLVVLTRTSAERLFGGVDVVGRAVKMESGRSLTVSGVVEDPPSTTHFRFNALVSMSGRTRDARYSGNVEWDENGGYVYVYVPAGTDVEALGKSASELGTPTLSFEPVTSIHLQSRTRSEIAPQGDIRYLFLFSGLGLLILLVAGINYVNLATARASTRSLEIGIRKAMGATKTQLRLQLLCESSFLALLSLPVAVLMAQSMLVPINAMAGTELELRFLLDVSGSLALIVLALIIGLIAGLYPAFFMSRTASDLSMRMGAMPAGSKRFRQSLVVVQFTATLVLIMTTVVMELQRQFIETSNLGFNTDQVITTPVYSLGDGYQEFKDLLLGTSGVTAVTSGPVLGLSHNSSLVEVEAPSLDVAQNITALDVDFDYHRVFGLSMQAGRFFSPDVESDTSSAVILNPAAVRLITGGGNIVPDFLRIDGQDRRVVGVVNEFHNTSLHAPIEPIIMRLKPGNNWTASVRLAPGNIGERLATVRDVWTRLQPERPFTYTILNQRISSQYAAEKRLASLFGLLAITAIALALLGLFGLAAFTAARRTKEIGIRKVLGATVPSVVVLLLSEFLMLVAIAYVLAVPVAYAVSLEWLKGYAFQVEFPWWAYFMTGLVMLAMTVLSIGYQAAQAALKDPVETLRYS